MAGSEGQDDVTTPTDGGCETCREGWHRGERPRRLLLSMRRMTIVYRCDVCGTYWDETERLAAPLSEAEAAAWADELSLAVVRYVGWGDERFPRERPLEVERTFGTAASKALVEDVREVIRDVGESVTFSGDDVADAQRVGRAAIATRHPELSPDAVEALTWRWSRENP